MQQMKLKLKSCTEQLNFMANGIMKINVNGQKVRNGHRSSGVIVSF